MFAAFCSATDARVHEAARGSSAYSPLVGARRRRPARKRRRRPGTRRGGVRRRPPRGRSGGSRGPGCGTPRHALLRAGGVLARAGEGGRARRGLRAQARACGSPRAPDVVEVAAARPPRGRGPNPCAFAGPRGGRRETGEGGEEEEEEEERAGGGAAWRLRERGRADAREGASANDASLCRFKTLLPDRRRNSGSGPVGSSSRPRMDDPSTAPTWVLAHGSAKARRPSLRASSPARAGSTHPTRARLVVRAARASRVRAVPAPVVGLRVFFIHVPPSPSRGWFLFTPRSPLTPLSLLLSSTFVGRPDRFAGSAASFPGVRAMRLARAFLALALAALARAPGARRRGRFAPRGRPLLVPGEMRSPTPGSPTTSRRRRVVRGTPRGAPVGNEVSTPN